MKMDDSGKGDTIWYRDVKAVFAGKNAARFFPKASMSVSGQLNALFRFCVYYSLIMVALTQNARHLVVALIGAATTMLVQEVAYKGTGQERFGPHGSAEDTSCTQPSRQNPYMNFNVFDPADKPPACAPWKVGDAPESAMGQPVQDSPYQRSFNRFYTMPSTTAVSDQDGFAKWLYGNMPSKSGKRSQHDKTPLPPTNA